MILEEKLNMLFEGRFNNKFLQEVNEYIDSLQIPKLHNRISYNNIIIEYGRTGKDKYRGNVKLYVPWNEKIIMKLDSINVIGYSQLLLERQLKSNFNIELNSASSIIGYNLPLNKSEIFTTISKIIKFMIDCVNKVLQWRQSKKGEIYIYFWENGSHRSNTTCLIDYMGTNEWEWPSNFNELRLPCKEVSHKINFSKAKIINNMVVVSEKLSNRHNYVAIIDKNKNKNTWTEIQNIAENILGNLNDSN